MSDKVPISGSRFLTGQPPIGMGLKFYPDEEKGVIAPVILDERHEGPPHHVHGGFSAALIDEAMGAAAWRAGYHVVAVHISFDLRAPLPLGVEVTVRGWVERVEGRKVFTKGTITLPDGRLAVEGEGIFVQAPQMFNEDFRDAFTTSYERGELE